MTLAELDQRITALATCAFKLGQAERSELILPLMAVIDTQSAILNHLRADVIRKGDTT